MGELAFEGVDGAKIFTATSFDERHAPDTIITGLPERGMSAAVGLYRYSNSATVVMSLVESVE